MNVYGFMIVKDEADILAQTLESLIAYGGFKKILIFDNNSTDDTFEVAQQFSSDRLEVIKLNAVYSDDLKYDMVYSRSNLFMNGDWFAILDGDELYTESQVPLIDFAVQQGFNCIEHNTAQFYLTDRDENLDFDRSKPACEQRRHYLLNYGEPRIFEYNDSIRLTASLVKGRSSLLKISPKKLLVHHFQYRSARQVENRIKNRIENNKSSNNWGHVKSSRIADYIVPAEHLHRYDGSLISGLPLGASIFKIRDNPAYTMANLLWLKKNGHLTPAQLEFFDASLLKKILKRIF